MKAAAALAALLIGAAATFAQSGPYRPEPASGSKVDTADEPFIAAFSVEAAAGYLDRRAHLVERDCYACHSTFTCLPARSAIDPLAEEVMRSRVLVERFMAMLLDPAQAPKVKTHHIKRVRILAAVELARHDAITTGTLAPLTRQSLDSMWKLQKPDGGIDWLRAKEAPQAIDDGWPAAMMELVHAMLDAHFRGRHVVWLLPVAASGLVRQAYAWGARNRETHLFSIRGCAPSIRGVTIPTFLPESG